MNAWFTVSAPRCEDSSNFNAEQLVMQTTRIHGILEREAAYLGGDYSRLVLGGSHQGGAVAVHATMSFGPPIGMLLCMRATTLPPSVPIAGLVGSFRHHTKVFVFAGERDAVTPLDTARKSFELLVKLGYHVEWHVELELGHRGENLNEQRFAAYWIARTCLGPAQGEMLKRAIVWMKRQETPPRRPKQRAASARSVRPVNAVGPETGFVHSLYREPEWRREPIKGPPWDTSTAPGFASPFSPIFEHTRALLTRIDRGGPMLGRVVKRVDSIMMPQPDLLGDVREQLPIKLARMGDQVVPESQRPTRAHSARPYARPMWNDDTSPRDIAFDQSLLVHSASKTLLSGCRTLSSHSPRHQRPASAFVQLDHREPLNDAVTIAALQQPRPTAVTEILAKRSGEGPRTRRLQQNLM